MKTTPARFGRFPLPVLALALTCLTASCKGSPGTTVPLGALGTSQKVDFRSLPVGTSDENLVPVVAYGSEVSILQAYIDGGQSGDFALLAQFALDGGGDAGSALPLKLQADGTTALADVRFTPTDGGSRTSALVIDYDPTGGSGTNGSVREVVVQLAGVGIPLSQVQLQVTPRTVDFGQLQLGQARTANIDLHNLNAFPVTPSVGGLADGGEFAAASPGTLYKNETESLQVSFVATKLGPATDTLQVASVTPCQGCQTVPVVLTGTGVDAEFKFSPAPVNFGFVRDGQRAPPITVTVTASGNVPVTLSDSTSHSQALTLAGGVSTIFSLSGLSVAAGATLPLDDAGPQVFTFQVGYSPSNFPGGDIDQALLHYQIDGRDQLPARLTLVGDRLVGGCQLQLTPSEGLAFPTVLPGAQATLALSATNTGGQDCQITGLSLDGGGGAFALGAAGDGGGPLPATITVPAHADLLGVGIPVVFTAPGGSPAHQWQASLNFASTDPQNLHFAVPLTASVASPYAASSPWPKWGHDNANTGQGEVAGATYDGGLAFAFSLVTAAAFHTPGCLGGPPGSFSANSPMIANRSVFAVGCDGVLYQVDERKGGLVFSASLQPPNLIPTYTIYEYAQFAAGPFATPIVAPDGVLFVNTFNPYQIDPVSRAVVSVGADGGGGSSNAAFSLGNELLYSYTSLIDFFSPQAAVGTNPPRQTPTPIPGQTVSPAVAEGDAGAVSYWCSAGTCVAVRIPGLVLWETTLDGGYQYYDPLDYSNSYNNSSGAPVLGDGQLFFEVNGKVDAGPDDGGNAQPWLPIASLNALDPETGSFLWSFTLPTFAQSPLSDAGPLGLFTTPAFSASQHLLYVPASSGLLAISTQGATRGQLAWQLAIDGGAFGSPALGSDGMIFLGTNAAGLLAIDPLTHAKRWSFVPEADGQPVAIEGEPALGPEGIYFIADNGVLYGIH